MAIQAYVIESGETRFKVYVHVRSKIKAGIRIQKRVKGIKTEVQAKQEEIKLTRLAEREVVALESELAHGEAWGILVALWEDSIKNDPRQKLSESTRQDYVASISKHTQAWWKRSAASISKADVKEVLSQMAVHSSSISYQNKVKVMINRVFIFGIESGLIPKLDKSPAHGINLGREEQKKPEILTIKEIRKLLTEAKNLEHPWFYPWAMALLTGMRNGELYALTWGDVDWENHALSITKSYNCRRRCVKSTKSGDWRSVPVSSELEALLKELKAQAKGREHVLPRLPGWEKGIQAKELRKFCLGIGLPSIKFHTLRACFATQLIRSGIPPIQIQKICGWKDLETMQRYVRLAGIEIAGVTEGLKVLPTREIMAKVAGLVTSNEMENRELNPA